MGLLVTGGLYAVATTVNQAKADTTTYSASDVEEGGKLFAANCATCHGMGASGSQSGPSLVGVGAAAVDFQVATGRMPMEMNGPQAQQKPAQFNEEQTKQMAAYVASLGPGPAIPEAGVLDEKGDAAKGGELFRTNCAMCHNAAAAGGALTRGKFARLSRASPASTSTKPWLPAPRTCRSLMTRTSPPRENATSSPS